MGAVVLAVAITVTVQHAAVGATNEPHVTLSADDRTTCAEATTDVGGMVDDAKAILASRHYQNDHSAFVLGMTAADARRSLEGYNAQAPEMAQRLSAASTALDALYSATTDDDRPYDETGHPPLTVPSATTITAAQQVVSSGSDLTDFCQTNG
ncbi:MAG: hypothetical protein ACXVX0_16285 [Blastococcus sp.]